MSFRQWFAPRRAGAVAAALLAVLWLVPAAAQEGGATMEQVELDGAMVDGFVASYPELQALGEEFEAEYGAADIDPEDPTSAPLAYSRYAEARARMDAALARHGFSGVEDWSRVAYSVMIAYSFADRGEDMGSMDEEIAAAIAQIETDTSIPDQQKNQLIGMLRQQMAQLEALRPSDNNIAVVADRIEQIRAVIDDAGGDYDG